jgi:hypothetical protein
LGVVDTGRLFSCYYYREQLYKRAMNQVNFRATDEEIAHLKKYCEIKKRQESEVIRELLRRLSISGVLNPLD